MNETIRVLIADDHPIVRQGLELVLSVQPDLELVAEANSPPHRSALGLPSPPFLRTLN